MRLRASAKEPTAVVLHLLLLPPDGSFLLDLPDLRLCHLPAVHEPE